MNVGRDSMACTGAASERKAFIIQTGTASESFMCLPRTSYSRRYAWAAHVL